MVALFMVAEAVRDWLREHGRMERPVKEEAVSGAVSEKPCRGSGDDDFDVDSEDLDGELIDALLEVIGAGDPRCKELKRIHRMPPAEQKVALRAQLKLLTPEEREALIGDSDSEDEAPAKPAVQLAPAQMECPHGHSLTAFGVRPPDYRQFDGDEYTCDVCGRDGEYCYGVYHCTKCFQQGGRQFDACPTCGGTAGGTSKPAKGKLILTESHPVRVVSDDANDVEAGTEITKIEPGKLQDSEAKDLKEGCKVIFGTRVAKLTGARKLLQNTEVFQVWFRPADHGVETFWVPLYGYLTKGDPPEVFEQSASQSVSSDSSLVRQPTPESFFSPTAPHSVFQ